MNPNARPFSFNPNARAFNFGGPGGPPSQGPSPTPTPPPPAGAAAQNRAPVSLSIGGYQSPSPVPPAPAGAAAQNRAPVSLSIGGYQSPSPVPPAPAGAAAQNRAPVSLSIGDSQSSSSTPPPAGAAAQNRAPVSISIGGGAKSASSTPPRAASQDREPVSKSASDSATKPPTRVSEVSANNQDTVLEQTKEVADEETLKDLYGDLGEELKTHLNVVFIGHVDAGKSTMGGNILYLCGMVDKRTMEKYEKEAKEAGRESWYLSWALDSTPQERAKGKTVEVGRAYFETGKRRYTILDAPGHKNFVPSMISGAAQADIAILVISARRGEFETGFEKGGQTREHAMLVKTAGVQKVIVVINKMDDPTVEWSKERYDEIESKLTPFLRASGFNPKTDLHFIPVSAYAGQNLKDRVSKDVAPWWNGASLLEYLDDLPMQDRKLHAPMKMPISEKYKEMGTIVVGKLEAGKIKRGDQLLLMPNKVNVEATAIMNEMEDEVPAAICGDNVRIRLKGVDDEDVSVGFVLTDVRQPVHAVTQFEAQLAILESKNIITAGYSAVMHIHTLAEEITINSLLHYFDRKTGRKSKRPPQFAKKGQKVVALIETTAPICIEKFSDYPQLGRFTLRDEGKTIAVGKVTKLIERIEDLPDMAALTVQPTA